MIRSVLDISNAILSRIVAMEDNLDRSLQNTDAVVSRLMATELNLGDTLPFETNDEINNFMKRDDGYKVSTIFLFIIFIYIL